MFLWTFKAEDGFSLSTQTTEKKQQRKFSFEKIYQYMFSAVKAFTHLLELYTKLFAYKFNLKKFMLKRA